VTASSHIASRRVVADPAGAWSTTASSNAEGPYCGSNQASPVTEEWETREARRDRRRGDSCDVEVAPPSAEVA
jgi:hypothetical protein